MGKHQPALPVLTDLMHLMAWLKHRIHKIPRTCTSIRHRRMFLRGLLHPLGLHHGLLHHFQPISTLLHGSRPNKSSSAPPRNTVYLSHLIHYLSHCAVSTNSSHCYISRPPRPPSVLQIHPSSPTGSPISPSVYLAYSIAHQAATATSALRLSASPPIPSSAVVPSCPAGSPISPIVYNSLHDVRTPQEKADPSG
jgi:hypothetical protein